MSTYQSGVTQSDTVEKNKLEVLDLLGEVWVTAVISSPALLSILYLSLLVTDGTSLSGGLFLISVIPIGGTLLLIGALSKRSGDFDRFVNSQERRKEFHSRRTTLQVVVVAGMLIGIAIQLLLLVSFIPELGVFVSSVVVSELTIGVYVMIGSYLVSGLLFTGYLQRFRV